MNTLVDPARKVADYQTYPISCYGHTSPVRVFQRMFPDDHYSIDIESFLGFHKYNPVRRGADLPWWGKHYFTDQHGLRVFIVSQDSNAPTAGSVALFAHLFGRIENRDVYKRFCTELHEKKTFRYASYNQMKQLLLNDWKMGLDFLYITDAAKVYDPQTHQIDESLSKELLEAEIALCDPKLIILLGNRPLKLLDSQLRFAECVDGGRFLTICGRRTVIAPFPIGMGRSRPEFPRRIAVANELVKQVYESLIP